MVSSKFDGQRKVHIENRQLNLKWIEKSALILPASSIRFVLVCWETKQEQEK